MLQNIPLKDLVALGIIRRSDKWYCFQYICEYRTPRLNVVSRLIRVSADPNVYPYWLVGKAKREATIMILAWFQRFSDLCVAQENEELILFFTVSCVANAILANVSQKSIQKVRSGDLAGHSTMERLSRCLYHICEGLLAKLTMQIFLYQIKQHRL